MEWIIFIFGMMLGASVALVIFGLLCSARDGGYPDIEDVNPGNPEFLGLAKLKLESLSYVELKILETRTRTEILRRCFSAEQGFKSVEAVRRENEIDPEKEKLADEIRNETGGEVWFDGCNCAMCRARRAGTYPPGTDSETEA